MIHKKFIIRQIAGSRKQAAVFVLCVTLSIVTLISLNGFSASVNSSLLKDAKALHAADIIARSNYELSPPLVTAVEELDKLGRIDSARVYEFYSVVRAGGVDKSLLANLKVVEPGYPFYGAVTLKTGGKFESVLGPGRIIVAQELLDRLGLQVGDRLHVGKAVLKIADVVIQEPDRPVSFFALGPRVFVSSSDLAELGLMKKGSRVRYYHLIKVFDQSQLSRIADRLRTLADTDLERVDTYRTAQSRVKRFFDNFLFFLSLIGIFTLVLAGIGIQSALFAFLKESEKTIAIMKTVGATSGFFTRHFIIMLGMLGFVGTLFALSFGFFLQYLLDLFFKGILPESIQLAISWKAVAEGLILGVLVVTLFSLIPLNRLKNIKPVSIFRKDTIRPKRKATLFFTGCTIIFFFSLLVIWQIKDIKIGLYFVLAVVILFLVTWVVTVTVLYILKRTKVKSLVARQAIKGLFRPRNSTKAIIITLTASLVVIYSIFLIEQNLDASFIKSYPEDMPNLFFLDIQPSQLEKFSSILGMPVEYYPIVRARILSVNGEKIDRSKQRRRRGDNLARTFNLTYRDHLLEDETIIEGETLFRSDWDDQQVSILDTVAETNGMRNGDSITFKIQGIPMRVKIASIRSRTQDSIRPFFYFVFPESILKDAPQSIFTAVKAEPKQIPRLQTAIVKQFPNVSAIDVTATILTFAKVVKKLSFIIRFFAFFSIIAGIMIIISSILATRADRIQESVYFKILGARTRFVINVITLENLCLAMVSTGFGSIFSQAVSWAVCRFVFDIAYDPMFFKALAFMLVSILLVAIVGWLPSWSIMRQKPVLFLREQSQE